VLKVSTSEHDKNSIIQHPLNYSTGK